MRRCQVISRLSRGAIHTNYIVVTYTVILVPFVLGAEITRSKLRRKLDQMMVNVTRAPVWMRTHPNGNAYDYGFRYYIGGILRLISPWGGSVRNPIRMGTHIS